MIYLYLKTHNKTGLKYLGQTSHDPFIYPGSGKYWTRHLKKHGSDVSTVILFQSEDKAEIKFAGEHYSKLWDIVESSDWANLIPESGSGGDTSASPGYKLGIANRDLTYKKDPAYISRVSESIKAMWLEKFSDKNFNEEKYKEMCSARSTKMWALRGIAEEEKLQRSVTMKEYIQSNPEFVRRLSISAKAKWQEKSKLYEITFPDGHTENIKCLRGWCKDKGLPYYKLYNTLRGNRPSDGWMVKIINDKSNNI